MGIRMAVPGANSTGPQFIGGTEKSFPIRSQGAGIGDSGVEEEDIIADFR